MTRTTTARAALLALGLSLGLAGALPARATADPSTAQVQVPDGWVAPTRVVRHTVTRRTTVVRRTVHHHASSSSSSAAARRKHSARTAHPAPAAPQG